MDRDGELRQRFEESRRLYQPNYVANPFIKYHNWMIMDYDCSLGYYSYTVEMTEVCMRCGVKMERDSTGGDHFIYEYSPRVKISEHFGVLTNGPAACMDERLYTGIEEQRELYFTLVKDGTEQERAYQIAISL